MMKLLSFNSLTKQQRWLFGFAIISSLLACVLSTGGFFPYRLDFDVYRTGGQVFLDGGDIYGELPELAHACICLSPTLPSQQPYLVVSR